jgi:hypothetical protein
MKSRQSIALAHPTSTTVSQAVCIRSRTTRAAKYSAVSDDRRYQLRPDENSPQSNSSQWKRQPSPKRPNIRCGRQFSSAAARMYHDGPNSKTTPAGRRIIRPRRRGVAAGRKWCAARYRRPGRRSKLPVRRVALPRNLAADVEARRTPAAISHVNYLNIFTCELFKHQHPRLSSAPHARQSSASVRHAGSNQCTQLYRTMSQNL